MAIEWTPWNVPMKRRLEVIAAALAMSIALFGGLGGTFLVVYFLVYMKKKKIQNKS